MSEITRENCMTCVLRSVPEFAEAWQRHLEYWGEDERSIGIDIGAFLDLTTELLAKDSYQVETLSKIFSVIERLLVDGDSSVVYGVKSMFLEDLLTSSERGRFDPSRFVPLLGPRSKEFCKINDSSWYKKRPGIWD